MAETKYGQYVINEPMVQPGKGFGEKPVFGYDDRDNIGVTYEYHLIDHADWSIDETRTHDTWELLCFLGADSSDMVNLGAEVGVSLGPDKEETLFSIGTIVSIPPGMEHGPVRINKFTKPFILLRIATTKEYEAKKAASGQTDRLDAMRDGNPVVENGNKYWMNFIQGPFFGNKEPGYVNMSISAVHNEYRSGTTLGYHCIYPEYGALTPHAHNHHELLCFLGSDPANITDLGAEVSVSLGEEQEEHVFTTASIVSIPSDLKHCPVKVTKMSKPIVFLVICTAGEKVDIW